MLRSETEMQGVCNITRINVKNKVYMFHIHRLTNIYTYVANQQMHTDKICFLFSFKFIYNFYQVFFRTQYGQVSYSINIFVKHTDYARMLETLQ